MTEAATNRRTSDRGPQRDCRRTVARGAPPWRARGLTSEGAAAILSFPFPSWDLWFGAKQRFAE